LLNIFSEKTARRWLKKLGFVYSRFTKGIYFDGHERSDVVEYRQKFLEDMMQLSIIILLLFTTITEKLINIVFIPADIRK
jgi:hypothetical protein